MTSDRERPSPGELDDGPSAVVPFALDASDADGYVAFMRWSETFPRPLSPDGRPSRPASRILCTAWVLVVSFMLAACSDGISPEPEFLPGTPQDSTQPSDVPKLVPDSSAAHWHGISVAVDGDLAVLGAAYSGPHVYAGSGETWSEAGELILEEGTTDDFWSPEVAMEGTTVVAGDPTHGSGELTGVVYVFERSDGSWPQVAELAAGDGMPGDGFGSSIAISGDVLVIGAPGDDDQGEHSGSAYVFTRSNGTWSEVVKLTASDGEDRDFFGSAVAVAGDFALIGARDDDDNGGDSGSVYVFQRSDESWSETAKLHPSDGSAGDKFGNDVAMDGDVAVVGAFQGDSDVPGTGSAYVFERSTDTWTEATKLAATENMEGTYFGRTVAVDGDLAVIGAPGPFGGEGQLPGTVYVFDGGAQWAQVAAFTPNDTEPKDGYARDVAVAGSVVVVGAPWDGDRRSSGSAYVFDLSAN